MTQSHFVVIRIVGRSNLDRARAEFRLNKTIRDDRNVAVDDWQHNGFANQMLVTIVVWIYRDSSVSQHCFRTRRRYGDSAAAVLEWVTKVVELAFLRLAQHFQIRQYGLDVRAPVNNPIAPVNHSVVVQTHK